MRSLSDRDEPEYDEARTIPDPVEDEAIQREVDRERDEKMCAAMSRLNERQHRILRLRYGMEGHPRTLEEIALREGITRERVRQIQLVAERKLRTVVEGELKDLVPVHVVGGTDAQPGAQEVLLGGDEFDEPSLAGQPLNRAFASPSVAVLPQEQPQLAHLDLEQDQTTMDERAFHAIT